jgi:hypothetical protein
MRNKPIRVAVMSAKMKAQVAAEAAHKSTAFGRWG